VNGRNHLAEGLEEVQRTPTKFVLAELQRLYPSGEQQHERDRWDPETMPRPCP